MIVDNINNWHLYDYGKAWRTGFSFLTELLASKDIQSIEEKKYFIDSDNIYARVMSYPTRTPREAKLETHDKYIDIQTTFIDPEGIEWYPRKSLEIKQAYNPEKDASYYHLPNYTISRVDVYPGIFAALFPGDAHMPQLIVNQQSQVIKKIVIKIKHELLTGLIPGTQ